MVNIRPYCYSMSLKAFSVKEKITLPLASLRSFVGCQKKCLFESILFHFYSRLEFLENKCFTSLFALTKRRWRQKKWFSIFNKNIDINLLLQVEELITKLTNNFREKRIQAVTNFVKGGKHDHLEQMCITSKNLPESK